ncbi:MAG: BON domain-containing protein [Pseudomonadales bacterium]|nr:BON domain-containing protein [Pseudomonadales bacterium]
MFEHQLQPGQHAMLRSLVAGLLIGLLAVGTGCAAYREGGSRTAGEVADDVAIQTAVRARLLADPDVKSLQIGVEVYRAVVTLNGRVPNETARRHVIAVAQDVKGVTQVEDRLTIVTE